MIRLAVLLSGRGSNFSALQAAISRGEIDGRIVAVISNVAAAPGLVRARDLGLPAYALAAPDQPHGDSAAQEIAILEILQRQGAELVCLAGYMRLLSAGFIERFRGSIVNIHPSLLPAFPGLHAQRQALEHGVKISGCTVHFVTAGLDDGPIILQRSVAVMENDDETALATRILAEEHIAYPGAVALLCDGRVAVDGRRARIRS